MPTLHLDPNHYSKKMSIFAKKINQKSNINLIKK